jgi:hypothetical protein
MIDYRNILGGLCSIKMAPVWVVWVCMQTSWRQNAELCQAGSNRRRGSVLETQSHGIVRCVFILQTRVGFPAFSSQLDMPWHTMPREFDRFHHFFESAQNELQIGHRAEPELAWKYQDDSLCKRKGLLNPLLLVVWHLQQRWCDVDFHKIFVLRV